jgi:hypothetical protein
MKTILGNRRFLKAYEDLQKVNKKKAAELLTKNIRDNLKELHSILQENINEVIRGTHTEPISMVIAMPDPDAYRDSSHPDMPPTHLGRRYAILSYIWLASLLELREVRPAIEEVIQFAKAEYKLFNGVNSDTGYAFRANLIEQSLYNPSLLVTATLCDPKWNVEKRKILVAKLIGSEVVDYQARSLEYDMPGREGLVPVVPHEGMLKIRYYRGITDAEFNEFFADINAEVSGITIPSLDELALFEKRTSQWLTEMKKETIEVTLQKLTDAAEYRFPGAGIEFGGGSFNDKNNRERGVYHIDIEAILSSRRFRKAHEDLQKIDKNQAAVLLTKNIKDNLVALNAMLQDDIDLATQGGYEGVFLCMRPERADYLIDSKSYRASSNPDYPPTLTGRRYAVFSYVLLASLLELQEVRPTVEEVIEMAKKGYELFNSVDDATRDVTSFKATLLRNSLYNPAILLTATLCDPTWNAEKRQFIEDKLVNREVVDWQAHATEYDMPGRKGLIPVVPHSNMLKIRYYKGITDAEFDDFFRK